MTKQTADTADRVTVPGAPGVSFRAWAAFPEYREAEAVFARLERRRAEVAEALAELADHRGAPGDVDEVALALLAGEAVDFHAAEGTRSAARALKREADAVNRAMAMQHERLVELRQRLGHQVKADVAAAHRAAAVGVAQALCRAGDLARQEAAIRDALHKAGAAAPDFAGASLLGLPGDHSSALATYLREMVETGYLSGDEDFCRATVKALGIGPWLRPHPAMAG